VQINLECNHATLAGHSCEHEATLASGQVLLGSVDANTGDPQAGWDADQFLADPREATLLAAVILRQGGLASSELSWGAAAGPPSAATRGSGAHPSAQNIWASRCPASNLVRASCLPGGEQSPPCRLCPRWPPQCQPIPIPPSAARPGGLNFDAKLLRESTSPTDLVLANISDTDAMARGLRNAACMEEEGVLRAMRTERYRSWADSKLERCTGGRAGGWGAAAARGSAMHRRPALLLRPMVFLQRPSGRQ
jgi:hypothetical protein